MVMRSLFLSLISVLVFAAAASAAEITIPVRVYLNKSGTKTKLVSKGTFTLPDAVNDNPATEGGSITFTQDTTSETIVLPAGGWVALGNPAGSKGFKYSDPTGATCKRVLVKATTIKALCRATAPGAPPYDAGTDAPMTIELSLGTPAHRYCAECPNGGIQKGNSQSITKLTDCAAPATCPAAQPTPTPSATPTVTPGPGVCCEVTNGCGSAPSSLVCLEVFGGAGVSDAVCDASGNCVDAPGTPGDCCAGPQLFFDACSMNVDQATCESNDGTFYPNSVCHPSGTCEPAADPCQTVVYNESFALSDGSPWPAAWSELGNSVSLADVQGGRARFRPEVDPSYSLGRMYAALDEDNVEVTFTVEFEDLDTQGVGFYVRQNGGYLTDTVPMGQGYAVFVEGFRGFHGIGVWYEESGVETSILIDMGLSLSNNVPYRVRFQVIQNDATSTWLRARIWEEGSTEPAGWNVATLDSTAVLQNIEGGIALDSWSDITTPNPIVSHTLIDDIEVRSCTAP